MQNQNAVICPKTMFSMKIKRYKFLITIYRDQRNPKNSKQLTFPENIR